MVIKTISDFRAAMRNGAYAWPGGYPLYFIMEDGEPLSFKAAKENVRLILESIATDCRDSWRVAALDINWEDQDLVCAHTGQKIEAAYDTE